MASLQNNLYGPKLVKLELLLTQVTVASILAVFTTFQSWNLITSRDSDIWSTMHALSDQWDSQSRGVETRLLNSGLSHSHFAYL